MQLRAGGWRPISSRAEGLATHGPQTQKCIDLSDDALAAMLDNRKRIKHELQPVRTALLPLALISDPLRRPQASEAGK